MKSPDHRLRAAIGAIALLASGCTVNDSSRAQAPQPTNEAPAELAFTEVDGPETAAANTTASSNAGAAASILLDDGQPGAWQQITDDARVGVHSAPDSIYTQLGVLEPGAGVVGTGRRADTGGVIWMEINWGDGTAWVLAAAFAPAG